jgi:hypothetical protein
MAPPTHMCTPLCTPPCTLSNSEVMLPKEVSAIIDGMLDAKVARSDDGCGNRATTIVCVGVTTVDVIPVSHDGNVCSLAFVQSHYGIVTSGRIDLRACPS